MTPSQIVRSEILKTPAYHVPDAAGLVKLDAMENPYRLPPELANALAYHLARIGINRYPSPSADELKTALRQAFGVSQCFDLLLGNGSDELIQIVAQTVARPCATVLAVEPSFTLYRTISQLSNLRYIGIPLLASSYELDDASFLSAIAEHQPALVFLASPNNPTGNMFPLASVVRIISATPGLVVVDEAYLAYSGEAGLIDKLNSFDNLIIMRTLSKIGLAGLRLGYLIGHPCWIAELNKTRLPYNVNSLTQAAATFLCSHLTVLHRQTSLIIAERHRVACRLSSFSGVVVYPSKANFIFFKVENARTCFEHLAANGVLIKCLHSAHHLLENGLRVTIGTPDENNLFLDCLASFLGQR